VSDDNIYDIPPRVEVRRAYIKGGRLLRRMVQRSIKDPNAFWANEASDPLVSRAHQRSRHVRSGPATFDQMVEESSPTSPTTTSTAILAKRGHQPGRHHLGGRRSEGLESHLSSAAHEAGRFAKHPGATRNVIKGDFASAIYLPKSRRRPTPMLACRAPPSYVDPFGLVFGRGSSAGLLSLTVSMIAQSKSGHHRRRGASSAGRKSFALKAQHRCRASPNPGGVDPHPWCATPRRRRMDPVPTSIPQRRRRW